MEIANIQIKEHLKLQEIEDKLVIYKNVLFKGGVYTDNLNSIESLTFEECTFKQQVMFVNPVFKSLTFRNCIFKQDFTLIACNVMMMHIHNNQMAHHLRIDEMTAKIFSYYNNVFAKDKQLHFIRCSIDVLTSASSYDVDVQD